MPICDPNLRSQSEICTLQFPASELDANTRGVMIRGRMRTADYLEKIALAPPLPATVETLRRLHLAHRETFLFENLTIQKGGGISLRLDDLARKFLDEGAGGYCFEHNTLFAAVLRDLGFRVTVLDRKSTRL